ncbi:hypothetical protein ACWF95_36330 [Streptomyces vinaceus]
MSLRTDLTVPEQAIPPGGSLTAHLRIWNESRIVDAYRLTLIGPPAQWLDNESDLGQLSVYPDTDEKINIPLVLPRDSSLTPGSLVFAIRVTSAENPSAVAVPEAVIQVGEFHDVELDVIRLRVAGALWSTNLVRLRNTGNTTTAIRLRVAPEDESAPLRIRLRRSKLQLKPGESARVGLTTRVTVPALTGTAKAWRVGVRMSSHCMEDGVVTFTHRQRPVLSKPALKAVVTLTAAVAAATALWFSPLGGQRPKARTETAPGPSQEQAREQTQQQAAEAEKEQADKKNKEQEAVGALRKKQLQYSLFVNSGKGKREDVYVVGKGYRLVVKTVQVTASGPATGVVILKAANRPLASMGVDKAKDYTPPTPLSLQQGSELALDLECEVASAYPNDATTPTLKVPKPSESPAPRAPGCTATAVITGDLVPLEGPFAEPDPPAAAPQPG